MVFKSEKKHEQKQQPHKTLQEDRRKKTVLCFSDFLRISVFCREEKVFTRSSFTTKTLQRQEEEQARIRKTHEYHQASKSLDARITSRQQQKGFRI